MAEEEIKGELVGEVFTYFSQVAVAGIKMTGTLRAGDKIRIKGHTTDFEQTIDSMQIERQEVPEAKAGDSIGIKVKDKVRGGDKVYVVERKQTGETTAQKSPAEATTVKKRGRPKKIKQPQQNL